MRIGKYTEKEIRYIRDNYETMFVKDIAKHLNREFKSVMCKITRMGLKRKRLVWNKNKKCPSRGRAIETQFKKGQQAPTYMPIGSIRKWRGYWFRKITDKNYNSHDNWKQIHLLLWEVCYGPIPDGYRVIFKDGNSDNIRISNLVLISHGDFIKKYAPCNNYPPEVVKLIIAKGLLTRAIRGKENGHKKRDRKKR